jgi:signal transduction histidine kinase
MKPPLSGDELKHLRHELRTPINHILGYSEILIEDAEAAGVPDVAAALRQVHAGGRSLLESIQGGLGDNFGVVPFEQLEKLEGKLRPEAERLLRVAEGAAGGLQSLGQQESLEDLERITNAFRRLLTLVRQMVDEPVAPAPAAVTAMVSATGAIRVPAAAAAPEGSGRMLIVDDNPSNRDLLRRRLEREGHRVREAGDGAQALEQLEQGEFDLIFLDVIMPVMDGFEVLARLKQDARFCRLPIIMISALDEVDSAVRCIEMGAEEYLPKPFDPVLLKARIGAILEKKRLRDRERQQTAELEQALQRLKETQDQLVVQEKMASLGALTAGIAHEIKNPLNFVTNFAVLSVDLLKDLQEVIAPVRSAMSADDASYLDGIVADLSTNLERIREHGKRADSIVRGMLAHSRGGSGQPEMVDLNALVAEAVNLAYHGLRATDSTFNVTMESDYDSTVPQILVVPQDLSRVFLNIANNACYAAHQKKLQRGDGFRPTLRVTTRNCGDNVEARIHDNGIGIPKSALQKIFNPFFTTKPTGSGTGLGLSLSYQIVVEQHKGNIKVNTEEGQFTEFVITLPKKT